MRPRPRIVPLVLAAVALVTAGCGEAQDVEYQRELRAVGADVADSLDEVPSDGDEPIEPAEVASLSEHLRTAADELGDLDPPDDAKAAQKRFQRGLRGVAGALEQLGRDLAKLDGDETAQAERFVEFATDAKIERAFGDLKNAQDDYARAGYDVFPDAVPTPPATASATSG